MSEDQADFTAQVIYAVLFASGSAPVPIRSLQRELNIPSEAFKKGLQRLKEILETSSPLFISDVEGSLMLMTRPEYGQFITAVSATSQQRKKRLSEEAMETLSIVAYKQPITKAQIDELRERDSEKTLETLRRLDLIKIVGNLSSPGAPLLYQTTDTFLRAFGLSKLADLPDIQNFPD